LSVAGIGWVLAFTQRPLLRLRIVRGAGAAPGSVLLRPDQFALGRELDEVRRLPLAIPLALVLQILTGLESWFTLPSRPGAPPPPPYKMALLTWTTIFPLITGVIVVLGPLLEGVSLVPRRAITTAVTVPLMTWIVMPRVTRALRGWLYP
jgi:hypothetical protein